MDGKQGSSKEPHREPTSRQALTDQPFNQQSTSVPPAHQSDTPAAQDCSPHITTTQQDVLLDFSSLKLTEHTSGRDNVSPCAPSQQHHSQQATATPEDCGQSSRAVRSGRIADEILPLLTSFSRPLGSHPSPFEVLSPSELTDEGTPTTAGEITHTPEDAQSSRSNESVPKASGGYAMSAQAQAWMRVQASLQLPVVQAASGAAAAPQQPFESRAGMRDHSEPTSYSSIHGRQQVWHRDVFFCRNIACFTPKIVYLYYLKKFIFRIKVSQKNHSI